MTYNRKNILRNISNVPNLKNGVKMISIKRNENGKIKRIHGGRSVIFLNAGRSGNHYTIPLKPENFGTAHHTTRVNGKEYHRYYERKFQGKPLGKYNSLSNKSNNFEHIQGELTRRMKIPPGSLMQAVEMVLRGKQPSRSASRSGSPSRSASRSGSPSRSVPGPKKGVVVNISNPEKLEQVEKNKKLRRNMDQLRLNLNRLRNQKAEQTLLKGRARPKQKDKYKKSIAALNSQMNNIKNKLKTAEETLNKGK